MINQRLQTSEESSSMAKQKRVLAAVAKEISTSEVDDIVADGMDICDIIDNHHSLQHRQNVTSNDLRSLGETIRSTLLEINEMREQNRERRHKELLEVLTKISQPNSSSTNCAIIDHCSVNNKKECLNDTKDQSSSDCVAEENKNMLQKKSVVLKKSNTISESNCSTTALQQEFNHIKHDQTGESLNFLSERNADVHTEASQIIHSITQKKGTIKACPKILGNRQIAVKQNTKVELQQMRARMLELQRKKMEDRERKKRQMQLHMQRQN